MTGVREKTLNLLAAIKIFSNFLKQQPFAGYDQLPTAF
jgi:hypothetical protein